ncbi:hypothetical protein DJ46_163 [Bacillus anthracis str. Vollum]|nr:hypothetical protein DJ48_2884 [Bacillus anthracis]AIK64846.1 hypothetical protein DJ46_163 [Bacillus anthracis str. Vollum]AJG46043.1 hypothetical protein AS53_3337 [Bacillus anthracis str. Turkey32]AJH45424.1 hypothetical protein AW20_1444 [Bacillus anthracis str. Sterne]AJH97262.1 hypothetical protein AK39_3877 [Bacillus anthracis str. V770-NP-1R]
MEMLEDLKVENTKKRLRDVSVKKSGYKDY